MSQALLRIPGSYVCLAGWVMTDDLPSVSLQSLHANKTNPVWQCQVQHAVDWPCRLLNKTDWFTQGKAAKTLTAILEARPDKEPFVLENGAPNEAVASQGVDHAIKTFLEWLCSQLR